MRLFGETSFEFRNPFSTSLCAALKASFTSAAGLSLFVLIPQLCAALFLDESFF
jgi:hypothetical protein